MNRKSLRSLLLVASALTLAAPAAAFAEAADAPVATAKDPAAKETTTAEQAASQLDEIVVTGTLRSVRLQEVPLAVSSIEGTIFANQGFKDPTDLQLISPSIQISQQGGRSIYIRGSGTASQNSGTEQSVGMVIDGVLLGFADDVGADISDVQHVEIYRGPQGTQFAKNASAGVVSITTKRPRIGVYSAGATVSYGEHDESNNNVRFNIPVSDTFAMRLSAAYQTRGGVFRNVVRNEDLPEREQYGAKAKFLWTPKARTSVYLSMDVRKEIQKPNFAQAWRYCGPAGPTTPYVNTYGTRNLPPCNGALLAGITPSPTNSDIVEEDDARRRTTGGGASLQIEAPIGEFQLTSISAYRFHFMNRFGPNGSGIKTNSGLFNSYGGPQWSQELRISSAPGRQFEYVAGLFAYRRSTHTKTWGFGPNYGQAVFLYPNTIYGAGVKVATAGGGTYADNLNDSVAAFTDGTFRFNEKLRLNGGIRVTRDKVSARIETRQIPGVFPTVVGGRLKPTDEDSTKATGVTYRVGPQYFFTDDLQVFATVAHGYKGPLVDTSVDDLSRIRPEKVNALEAGLKSSWFENRLTANVTVFRQKFKDYQVTTLNTDVNPNVFQLGNAGGMLSKGIEAEFEARPVRDWTFTASGAYLDAHYTDFVLACLNAAEPIKQPVTTDPTGRGGCYTVPGTTTRYSNAAGFPLINASKFTYRLGVNYQHTFSNDWMVDAGATFMHRSKFWSAAANPNLINNPYGTVNLTAGISGPTGNWRLGFYARNLFDKFYTLAIQQNNGGATNVLSTEAVRTVGVTLDLKFGE